MAKLLALHLVADFAVPRGDGLPGRWAVRGRVVMAAVDFCLISQLLPSLIAYAELPELPYASDLDTQTLE